MGLFGTLNGIIRTLITETISRRSRPCAAAPSAAWQPLRPTGMLELPRTGCAERRLRRHSGASHTHAYDSYFGANQQPPPGSGDRRTNTTTRAHKDTAA